MNIVPIFVVGYSALFLGFRYLKKSITSVPAPDDTKITPAAKLNDNRDYVPTRREILFGHHYMSIAGTSPIIASIVGLIWGWGPALLWMLLGVLLIGGVHDYYSLMLSVRYEGKSMGDIVREKLGNFSGLMVSLVMAFGGILVYAIFLSIIVSTLAETPTAVFPTLALIPIAILCGILLKKGLNLILTTVIGIMFTIVFIFAGINYPIAASKGFWSYFFLIYTFFAIYVPVWILLQPRDYLNFAILSIGLMFGFAGLIIGHPSVKMPFFHSFFTDVRGPLWPMLFVTISCGAASGWHALISSGTTSKQLSKETDAYPVAYGSMLGETVMAVLSASLVITAFTYGDFIKTGLTSSAISELFSHGLGNAMTHLGISKMFGSTMGALALTALTLTTLDSFARTGRYVVQEIGKNMLLKHRLPSSIFVAGIGFILYKFVPFIELWNGLVLGGLIILIIPFTILLANNSRKRNFSFYLHTVLPLCFLIPTTISGLIYLFYKYLNTGKHISLFLIIFLFVLTVSILIEGTKKYLKSKNDSCK